MITSTAIPYSLTIIEPVYSNNFSNEKYTAGGQPTNKTNSLSEFGWYGVQ